MRFFLTLFAASLIATGIAAPLLDADARAERGGIWDKIPGQIKNFFLDRGDEFRRIMNDRIDALVEKARPMIADDVNTVMNETKFEKFAEVPKFAKKAAADILGITYDKPPPKNSPLHKLWKAILAKGGFEKLYGDFVTVLRNEVSSILADSSNHITNATIRGIQNHFHLKSPKFVDDDDYEEFDSEGSRLFKRWKQPKWVDSAKENLDKWIAKKVDATVDDIMKEVRPEIHIETLEILSRTRKNTPKQLRAVLEWYLPEELKVEPPQHANRNARIMPNPIAILQQKLKEFVETIRKKTQTLIANTVAQTENEVNLLIEAKMKKTVAKKIPFGLYQFA